MGQWAAVLCLGFSQKKVFAQSGDAALQKKYACDFNMYFGSQNNMGFTPNYMYATLTVRPARVEKK